MQRIIYLDIDLGYKFADVKTQQNLVNKELKLTRQGHQLICVLNLENGSIVSKGESFQAHAGFVKSCYPNIFLNEPTYTPIAEYHHLTVA